MKASSLICALIIVFPAYFVDQILHKQLSPLIWFSWGVFSMGIVSSVREIYIKRGGR